MREDDLNTPPIDEFDESDIGAADDEGGTFDDATDDESDDAEILDILAFEQERMRSWKRRSNALLAALRRHHPERDPARREASDNQRRGVNKKIPRGVSAKPRGASVKQPSGASEKEPSGASRSGIASPPLQPIPDGTMRAAHVPGDSVEQRAGRGDAASLRGFEIARIKRAVCRHYAVTMTELVSPRRQTNLVRARQVGMYVAKIITSRSLPEIGRHFGDRDHTTVLHAVRKIEADLDSYREEIAAICDAQR